MLLGRLLYRWEYNIKKYIKEIECGTDWIHVAQDMDQFWYLVHRVTNLLVHKRW
jgi:hypothetical protein